MMIDINKVAPVRLGKVIGIGSHAVVYEVLNKNGKPSGWVAKIGEVGRYSPPLIKGVYFGVSRKRLNRFIVKTIGKQYRIYPDIDYITDGLEEYRLIASYFKGSTSTEKRKELLSELKDSDSMFYKIILRICKSEKRIKEIVGVLENNFEENFIVDEHLIIGHPVDVDYNHIELIKHSLTYYILQKKVSGKNIIPLYRVGSKILSVRKELTKKLLLFTLLQRKMFFDTGKLIDTRPEEILKSKLDWFCKTANILVDLDNDDVYFIDTRWLWDVNSVVGQNGINIIKYLGVRSVDKAIYKYANLLVCD